MTGQPILLYSHYLIYDAVKMMSSVEVMLLIFLLLLIIAGLVFILIRKNRDTLRHKANARQKLITTTIASQEAERKRLAAVLHDSFCARLSIIKLMLHNLKPNPLPGEIFTQIDEAYQEARILSHQLDSPVLDRLGLVEAIRDHIRPLYGILQIEVHILQVFTHRLAKHIELHLFRILQESVTNVIKHANASIVQIDIHFSRQFAALRITDNGVGFTAKDKSEGAGLKNIRMRVSLLGGNYRMRSQPQQGTSLLVSVPLENHPARTLSLPVTGYNDESDHEDINIYLNAKKQRLYATGTRFIFSPRRRRTPFYRRYRKHHTSKNKTQSAV